MRVQQPCEVQTIQAYEDDFVMTHLYNTLEVLSRHNSVDFGIAQILEYRERMYPDLFPMSIDVNKLDNTQTTKTRLYIEAVKNRTFK